MNFRRLILTVMLITGILGTGVAHAKFIVYTSMKESLIGAIKDGFVKKYPDIDMDYQSAGAGKLMAKIATEREAGKIMADVIWTSEVPDFYAMKKDGILLQYKPKGLANILNPLKDTDNFFVAARLGTLGIVYNTKDIKNPPKEWKDLFGKDYKKAFSIANPSLSGTSYISVAMLEQQFGWEYFKELRKNGAKVGKGSGQVVDDTASGELAACIGVDYITNDKIRKGAHLALVYPKEILLIPSPVGILKDTKNLETAQKFIEYLLSEEAQTIIANEGTLPVHKNVKVPAALKMPNPAEAVSRAIVVDYQKMMTEKEARVKTFLDIMQK